MGYQIKYNNEVYSITPATTSFNVKTSNNEVVVVPVVDLTPYLKIRNVQAGSGVTINYSTTGVTINSTSGGGTITGATNGLAVFGKNIGLGSGFNTYSATTLTNINSRLLKSDFNYYTGNTSGGGTITGATNGLSLIGKNIGLGGVLSGDINIDDGDINSTHNFLVGSTQPLNKVLFNTTYNNGAQSASLNIGSDSQSLIDLNVIGNSDNQSEVIIIGNQFNLRTIAGSGNISSNITGSLDAIEMTYQSSNFKTSDLSLIKDQIALIVTNTTGLTASVLLTNSDALKYGADYSSRFKKYSLVDANYVTGLTSQSITGATNIGTGVGLFTSVSNRKNQLKTLVAGTNITLTPSSNSITISSTGSTGTAFAQALAIAYLS